MQIAITGTPGVGKTFVAKKLSKILGYRYIDLNKYAEEKNFVKGFNEERECKILDLKKIKKIKFPKDCVIDGHLSHFCKVDLIICLRTNPEVLRRRLFEKGWSKEKVRENVEAESLDIIASDIEEMGKKSVEIDTSKKNLEETVEELKKIVNKNL